MRVFMRTFVRDLKNRDSLAWAMVALDTAQGLSDYGKMTHWTPGFCEDFRGFLIGTDALTSVLFFTALRFRSQKRILVLLLQSVYSRIKVAFTLRYLKVPTFLEGHPSRVFRTRTDDEGWGKVVNLSVADLEAAQRTLDLDAPSPNLDVPRRPIVWITKRGRPEGIEDLLRDAERYGRLT